MSGELDLETQVAEPPVAPAQADLDQVINGAQQDQLIAALRAAGLSVPEGKTGKDVTDYLMEVQEQAEQAVQYRARLQEIEALEGQRAARAVQQQREAATTTTIPESQKDEYKLPWEPIKVDPAFRHLVQLDPQSGMYVPAVTSSLAHIQAADDMNRRRAYEQQVVQAMLDDPRGFGETLTKRQFAALEAKLEERFKKYDEQFIPVQQLAERSAYDRAINEFIEKHGTRLFVDENTMTPLGAEVDWIMREFKLSPDDALAKAEARLGKQTESTPGRPGTISKVAGADRKPRFIDRLSHGTREIVNKPDAGTGINKKNPGLKDLEKEYAEWVGNSN